MVLGKWKVSRVSYAETMDSSKQSGPTLPQSSAAWVTLGQVNLHDGWQKQRLRKP
jgi:hypothetical protein